MALAVYACVYASGTEPGPEYYICHPNAVTTTHVWRRILCNSTHTSAAPSLQDCVCVCVYEYIFLCICAFICVLICVYDVYLWHFNMCICTCMQVCVQVCEWRLMLSLTVCLLCFLCLCDRLTCAQMVDDEHMNFTSHLTCWHDNSVKAYMMKIS